MSVDLSSVVDSRWLGDLALLNIHAKTMVLMIAPLLHVACVRACLGDTRVKEVKRRTRTISLKLLDRDACKYLLLTTDCQVYAGTDVYEESIVTNDRL